MRRTSNKTTVKARELRRTMSLPENMLWQALHKRPAGFKFRRQHPLGPFIVDFYCHKAALVVEVDGDIHDLQQEEDARREKALNDIGLRIVRFRNKEVLGNLSAIVSKIKQLTLT